MSEFVNKRREQFTILSNAALRDPRLSLKAKGLLALLLSFPDDWAYHLSHIETMSTDGREATRNALREIERAGYLVRKPKRGQDGGKLAGWCYEVSDSPSDGETVSRETRLTGKPSDGKPAATKTDLTKTEETKKTTPPTPQGGEAEVEPEQDQVQEPQAVAVQPPAPAGSAAPPEPDQSEPVTALQGTEPPTGTEQVPPAAPRQRQQASDSEAQALLDAWNANRGPLPEVQALNEGRRKAATKLLRDCGWNLEAAVDAVADATREVASDEWWVSKRLGFDVVVPGKVQGKAEAYRARSAPRPAGRRDYGPAPAASTAPRRVYG